MLLYPTYFSPIIQYVAVAKANKLLFEIEDNYQKQTYRTRCYIYGANGKQLLNIPIQHANKTRKTKDIQIDYNFNWQKLHVKSIQSAYRSSPYFEFFEEDLLSLFDKNPKFLLDFNFECLEYIIDSIQLEVSYNKTKEYHKKYIDFPDLRFLADAKSERTYNLETYTQVFSDKYGFIKNLSILDLLFMEGPNALSYLENQMIDFSNGNS